MRIPILALRTLQTVFLLLSVNHVWTVVTTPDRITHIAAWQYRYAWFELAIAPASDRVVASTLLLGYVFSLAGNLLQGDAGPRALRWLSLAAAALGLAGFANELLRRFFGHPFAPIVHSGIFLVALDWPLFWYGTARPAGPKGGSASWSADDSE